MSGKCRACKGTRKLKWDMSEGSKPHVVYVDCPFCKEGEQGMKEGMTKEWLQGWFDTVERIDGARPDALAVWAKIEADREAIRDETREELLKDHFKLGHRRVIQDGRIGTIGLVLDVHTTGNARSIVTEIIYEDSRLRRPPKKRALTNAEMAEELHVTDVGELNKELEHLDGDTLKRLCDVLRIPTEVEEWPS